jgi:hypothetical protein
VTTIRRLIGHNHPERIAFERSAVTRNKALCTGLGRDVVAFARAAGYEVTETPAQPHRWYPVGRSGAVCLRCSAFQRGA